MITLVYERSGETFTDFELREMKENKKIILEKLSVGERYSVSNGLFIYIVQIMIAQNYFPHDEIVLEIEGTTYEFNKNGQLKNNVEKLNYITLTHELREEFFKSMY